MPATLLSDFASLGKAHECSLSLRLRAGAIALAFAGSGLFGASLSLVLPGWGSAPAALWLIASAGMAWVIFIPALTVLHRLPLLICLDAALIAITGGEVVLLSGAMGNLVAWSSGAILHAAAINFAVVAISNVVMAALLARELRKHGVAITRTIAAWVLILDGSGALFFAILYSLLHGA